MKIKMLRNAAASCGCKLTEGESGVVADDLAATLIAIGVAVEVQERPKQIKAVPPQPSISDSTE